MSPAGVTRTIANVLGALREVTEVYPDGSYNCPWCGSAVLAPRPACDNPWCLANPQMPVAEAQRLVAEHQRREDEKARRQRDHQLAMERIEADRARHEAWLQQTYAEAQRRGACPRCLIQPGWERAKFIRHRGGVCPKVLRGGQS